MDEHGFAKIGCGKITIGTLHRLAQGAAHLWYGALHGRRGFAVTGHLSELLESQYLDAAALESLQLRKLRLLLEHLRAHVPYYRNWMEVNGFFPSDVRRSADVECIPMVSKEQIRADPTQFQTEGYDPAVVTEGSTGGSTGEPLKFLRDQHATAVAEACGLRSRTWAGIDLWHTGVTVSAAVRISRLGRLRQGLLRRTPVCAFQDDDGLRRNLETLRRVRPSYLYGYPSVLEQLAELAEQSGVDRLHVPTLFTTGETLMPHQRELFGRVFGSRVYDYYGCNEVSGVAHECSQHEKHISVEHVLVECSPLQEHKGPGQGGEVLVTDLDNFSMPFVRYRVGDLASIETDRCTCGLAHPRLVNLQGRVQDRIVTPSGYYVPSLFFSTRFRDLTQVRQYQLEQTTAQGLVLRFVLDSGVVDESEVDYMVREIRELIGGEMVVERKRVSHIPLTPRGKSRLVISRVQSGRDSRK